MLHDQFRFNYKSSILKENIASGEHSLLWPSWLKRGVVARFFRDWPERSRPQGRLAKQLLESSWHGWETFWSKARLDVAGDAGEEGGKDLEGGWGGRVGIKGVKRAFPGFSLGRLD